MMELSLPFKGYIIIEKIEGGSLRKFYRVEKGKKTFVVMYTHDKKSQDRYIQIGRKLFTYGICVPEFYEIKDNFLLMEDLRDMSLLKYVRTYGADSVLYNRVIDELVRFQNLHIEGLPLFGYKKLYGEFEHFKQYYVPIKHINIDTWRSVAKRMAEECSRVERVLMHRDFQSTNIYIKEGNICFLDFQDMHVGPFYFDLASLVYDPYVMLQSSFKWELIEYYASKSGFKFNERVFLYCGALRMMQAVGAFIRLSSQGKVFFKMFIKKGECTLKNILLDAGFNELADGL